MKCTLSRRCCFAAGGEKKEKKEQVQPTNLRGGQRVSPAVEGGLGEPVPAGVGRLFFGHQGLGPFDDVAHAVDEALLL